MASFLFLRDVLELQHKVEGHHQPVLGLAKLSLSRHFQPSTVLQ